MSSYYYILNATVCPHTTNAHCRTYSDTTIHVSSYAGAVAGAVAGAQSKSYYYMCVLIASISY